MRKFLASALVALLVACTPPAGELSDRLIASDDLQESAALIAKVRGQGEAIPILLKVLSREVSNRHSALEIGKTNLCLKELHTLALRGNHRIDEVPVLLKVIREQTAIQDTLVTAEILKAVTGLDVGYSKEFVERYQAQDEPERLRRVQMWEDWYKKQNP